MQVALQQQHIWVEVGSNGEAINRIGTATKGFPDQHDFVIGDEEEGFSEELREPVKRNETSQESFADVVTGSADGKIFEKEMMNFNELCSEIIDILEDPPGKAMKRFEKIRPNSELLDKFMDNKIKSNKIESLAEDVDGAILFTSLFSNKLKIDKFSKQSLEIIRCNIQGDWIVPSVESQEFFSDLVVLYRLKDCNLNQMLEEIRNGKISGEIFTNVISLLRCLAGNDSTPTQP